MRKAIFLFIILSFSLIIQAQNDLVISEGIIFDGEPYLVINPANSQHFVVAWMSFEFQQEIVIRSKVSWDGGESWSSSTYIPHLSVGHASADVSMQFDHEGKLFLAFVDYDNDNGETGAVYVSKSSDGGLSWNIPTEAISITDCPNKLCIDRPWMVIDKNPGPNQGNIYITTMNAALYNVEPPYNPYLVTSIDNGETFSTPILIDGGDYLAGNIIAQPVPTPAVAADGKLHISYPSYLQSQSLFPRMIHASTTNMGIDFEYHEVLSSSSSAPDNLLKTGPLLITNPSNSDHLALFVVRAELDDPDIYITESLDHGVTWSEMQRVNDDEINNGKSQDLVWADFDINGNLAVCWRDRRDDPGNGFEVASEIYGTWRGANTTTFSENFEVSSQPADHEDVLNGSGNDFMCIELVNDTLNAVWGDVRSGTVSIYLNRISIADGSNSLIEVSSEKQPEIGSYPNPCQNYIYIKEIKNPFDYQILTQEGKVISTGKSLANNSIAISNLINGSYYLKVSNQDLLQFIQFTVLNP